VSGAIGILMVLLIVLLHLTGLRSFGTPFLSPIAPLTVSELKDTFVRVPLWAMLTRPRTIQKYNSVRQQPKSMPSPPNGD
jgi:spore germination protein KA